MNLLFRKTAAVLLCAAMLCSGACLTGCSNGPDGASSAVETAYSPTMPENPISPDAEGAVINAKVGETVNYQDKVSVTLDKVVELDNAETTVGKVFVAEFTITNNSDATIDCTILTHFTATRNGVTNAGILRNTASAIFARKYYTAIGSDLMSFNNPIAAGETLTGYVYMRVEAPYEDLSISYIPYKYYSNDAIVYEITEEDLEHYTATFPSSSNN